MWWTLGGPRVLGGSPESRRSLLGTSGRLSADPDHPLTTRGKYPAAGSQIWESKKIGSGYFAPPPTSPLGRQ